MHWIAPAEKDTDNAALEKCLWDAAEQAVPAAHVADTGFDSARPGGLLGLIFLRFAEVRFAAQRARPEKADIKLVLPGDALAEKFCSLVKSLSLQQVSLEKSAQNLRRTRDLLLPRLLAGQVSLEGCNG